MKALYRWWLVSAAILVAATATWAIGAAPEPPIYLPAITKPGVALPPPDEASARLTVPARFAVRIFARDLDGPRLMALGPDGQLYVAARGGRAPARRQPRRPGR
jgi:hypothetical protein